MTTYAFIKGICHVERISLQKILDKMKAIGTGRIKVTEECTFMGYGTGSGGSTSGYPTYRVDSAKFDYVKQD